MPTATTPDPQTLVADSIRKVSALATLPEVTAKIVSTVEDPRSTAGQLHKIISHDPALVTRILKVANSAFYGVPGQIGSVERAIVMLGLNAIKNLAVAASLGQMFRGVQLCEGFTARDLWTHCIAVGVTARDLARRMNLPYADEAFLAGMIHDVGLLVSLQVFPEKLAEVCRRVQEAAASPSSSDGGESPDFCAVEQQIIGTDHQRLGAALAEQWRFPRSCQLVAGYHHRPTTLDDNNRMLVTLVYIADTLCCQGGRGFNLTGLHQKIEDAGLPQMQIDPHLIEETTSRIDDLVKDVAVLLA